MRNTTYSPNQLKRMREERGLSLRDLAKATGIDYTALSRVEAGERRPSAATAIRLSRYYNEPLDKFWQFGKVSS